MTQLLGRRGEGDGKKKGWIITVLVRTGEGRTRRGGGGVLGRSRISMDWRIGVKDFLFQIHEVYQTEMLVRWYKE